MAREAGPVVAHAVDHEAVQTITGPAVAGANWLEHEEGLAELARPRGGPVEGEIPADAALGDHPVQNETAVRGRWTVHEQRRTNRREVRHNRVTTHRNRSRPPMLPGSGAVV